MNVQRGFKAFVVGGAALGTALALAGPASAEPLSGNYSATVGNPPMVQTWAFTPCGPDCSRLELRSETSSVTKDLRLQGGTWVWSNADGCTTTIDAASLSGSTGCGFMTFPVQLTKAG